MTPPPSELSDEQRATLARVRLLALDVDGTLTDGGVVYVGDDDATELQRFCVRDGQGMAWLKRADVRLAWITGRGCAATRRRARELEVDAYREKVGEKRAALAEVQEELGVAPDETAAMGDDLPDLALAQGAAFFAAPADARPEVRARADLVTASAGGDGAVRELCEHILQARGSWRAITGASAS